MAQTLYISDGTVTVYLTQGNATLLHFVPRAPGDDGGPVVESARAVWDVAVSTARSDINKLNRLFEQARNFAARQIGPQVFVYYKPESGDDIYRSPLFHGRCDPHEQASGIQYLAAVIEYTIGWKRAPYWEGPEVEVELSNGNEASPGTPATGGLPVFNCNDGTGTTPAENRNWVQIAAAQLAGDLRAPLRYTFENETAGTPRNRRHYVGALQLPDPANLPHILEAEAADGKTGTSEAGNSGGKYDTYTLTGSEATAFTWTLTDGQVEALGAGWYLPLVITRVGVNLPSNTLLRLQLIDQAVVLWQQDFQKTMGTSDRIQRLPSLQIPPQQMGADFDSLGLRLTAQGSGTLALDCLALMPMDAGLRRLLPNSSYGLAQNEAIEDDGIRVPPRVRVLTGGDYAARYGDEGYNARPIEVYPNRLARLHFFWDATDGTAAIARTATVRVYHRPRRSTL